MLHSFYDLIITDSASPSAYLIFDIFWPNATLISDYFFPSLIKISLLFILSASASYYIDNLISFGGSIVSISMTSKTPFH